MRAASKPEKRNPKQIQTQYLKRATAARAKCCGCGLSLSELTYTIEKTEFDLCSEVTEDGYNGGK
ncbi:MAG: hypothetical protein EA424_13855 [Planctomycetaceae bacterium]|nr:MAG: hypothetical protein EA424_13855 [Planctomycetaceae bacterium]